MMSITPSTAKASACPRDPADNTTAVYVSECCSSGEDPGHFYKGGREQTTSYLESLNISGKMHYLGKKKKQSRKVEVWGDLS